MARPWFTPKLQTYPPAGVVFTGLGVLLSVCIFPRFPFPDYCDTPILRR